MDDTDRRIIAAVERRADVIVRTTAELIGFPSVVPVDSRNAGPAERDCQLYLQARLHDLGFKTDLWDPDGPALFAKHQGRPIRIPKIRLETELVQPRLQVELAIAFGWAGVA